MHLTPDSIVRLAKAYVQTLEGSDVKGALELHSNKAALNLSFVDRSGPDLVVAHRVLRAANAQGKLQAFVLAAQNDGVDLSMLVHSPSFRSLATSQLPQLQVSRCIAYIPIGSALDEERFPLLEGRILNDGSSQRRVVIEAYVTGTSDVVRRALDVPPGGTEIPSLRVPRFTSQESERISLTTAPAILNVELHLAGTSAPVDVFQREIWVSQPDIVLLARVDETQRYEDHTSSLAWWVNSGAKGLADFLATSLSADARRQMGYLLDAGNSCEDSQRAHVELQVRALYEAVRQLRMPYFPPELVWVSQDVSIIQRIRRPHDTLGNPERGISCLDGAILFASLLEYMGIDPVLVLIPRHALVGWKWRPVRLDMADPESVWESCGLLDPTFLTTELSFDVAVSAAQGSFIECIDLVTRESGPLGEFARIIDVIAARGFIPLVK